MFDEKPRAQMRPCFHVDSACQGQEGLALVQQSIQSNQPYAVAFVDIRMPPGWDGVETTQKLWEVDPTLQVVICTAYSDYSWDELISKVAPAVKPITTVCEMKLTSTPMRAIPRINWNNPVRNVRVRTMLMNCGELGSAKGLMAANTAMEMAVVGPETRCQLDPNNAAMIAGSMAAYRPYSGGMPAMVAKATPCGNTINAPVIPAIRSARVDPLSTMCHQFINGNRRCSQYVRVCWVFKMIGRPMVW